jgi:hypothetical protein
MRNVVSNSEIPHLWAHKRQPSARNGKDSFYFKDETIFSYGPHFPIAKHLPGGAIAFTRRTSSPTTNGHMNAVRRAIPQGVTVVYVLRPTEPAVSQREAHEKLVEEALKLAAKARKHAESHRAHALRIAEDFNRYADLLGESCRIDTAPITQGDLAALRKSLADADARRQAEAEEAQRQAAVRLADAAQDWRNHGPTQSWQLRSLGVLLRLSADRSQIETSQGAVIPTAEAVALWPLLATLKARGKAHEFSHLGRALGAYRIERFKADGSLIVGCHDIPWAELERMATALDLDVEEAVAA